MMFKEGSYTRADMECALKRYAVFLADYSTTKKEAIVRAFFSDSKLVFPLPDKQVTCEVVT